MSTEESTEEAPIVHRTWVWRGLMGLIHPACWTVFRTTVEGREFVPREGGAILAANHCSWLDIPLMGHAATPRHVGFVARKTLAESRTLGFIMRNSGALLIERGSADRAALRAIGEHLDAGDLVAIFPEGTRSFDGRLGDFKGGALLAARKAGVPVIPCGIEGAYHAWPRDRRYPRPARIHIRFGEPIDPAQPGALERLRSRVAELSGQATASEGLVPGV